jgi:hypothetical protein
MYKALPLPKLEGEMLCERDSLARNAGAQLRAASIHAALLAAYGLLTPGRAGCPQPRARTRVMVVTLRCLRPRYETGCSALLRLTLHAACTVSNCAALPTPEGCAATQDFDAAYKDERGGVAWRVFAYETEPDEDTEWTGYENPTGLVLAHMIGDDRETAFDPDDLEPIKDEDYCSGCGQIGCGWC